MATSAVIAGLSLAVSAAGAYASYQQQSRAADAREEARDAQQARAREQNRQARAQAVERARRRRAAVVAQGQARGALDSSPVQGALGAFESDVASNLGFQRQITGLEQERIGALSDASQAQGRARTFQAIGSVPSQLGFTPASSVSTLRKSFANSGSTGGGFQGVGAATPRRF